MLYEKMLTEHNAYVLYIGDSRDYELHCHPDFEISYCLQGSYTIVVNDKHFFLKEGDLVIINAMEIHEFFQDPSYKAKRLTIKVGPGFLGEHFAFATKLHFDATLYHLDSNDPHNDDDISLIRLFDSTVELHPYRSGFPELALRGNIYLICSILFQKLQHTHGTSTIDVTTQDILRIEMALNYIYDNYAKPITLDAVCALSGYSKSHFCRMFKAIVDDTFHNVLNRHRVKIACLRLRESRSPIASIAADVGFADAKSFCRVFKQLMDVSPATYRKNNIPIQAFPKV